LSTLRFFRRKKKVVSIEDEGVPYADIPKERGVL
jgi:hypothetical protein